MGNALAVAIGSVGAIVNTAFASYLPDQASIPAITNAMMLVGLPSVLLATAVSQSLLPQITMQATHGRYLRMSLTISKIVGGAVLLCIPAALALYFFGKPAIHLLFQHGAFNAHSSALTSMALFGYAVGLPGLTATVLLVTCFYALKDARTPLFTGIVTIVVRIALLPLLFKLLKGRYTLLAIPLAASIGGTAETACLSLILCVRLRKKIQTDKGVATSARESQTGPQLQRSENERREQIIGRCHAALVVGRLLNSVRIRTRIVRENTSSQVGNRIRK